MTHSARNAGRLGLLLVAALVALALAAGTASASSWTHEETSFVDKVNASRQAAGLPPLAVNPDLTVIARAWSEVMAAEDTMYHNPRYGEQAPAGWQRIGENVGFTTNNAGAPLEELVVRLHDAFMNSEGHRRNILGEFNQVGVGVVVTASGKMWVTVSFMLAPLAAPSPPTPAPPPPASAPAPTGPAPAQVAEAVNVSRDVFADAGSGGFVATSTGAQARSASHVVLGRAEVFADALGGAGLAGDNGPMLFTPGPSAGDPNPGVHPAVRSEIDRVLGGRGTVYVLGGSSAVSDRVVDELATGGYDVRRLEGASRVETSVAVAREVLARRGRTGEVLVAQAANWADAVTGGAYAAYSGSPVVLTPRGQLHPAVEAFLRDAAPARRWALGGPAALSDDVVGAAGAARVAGADRVATAVAIAERLWGRTSATPGDVFVMTPAYDDNGWAYALAYAPWSAVNRAPQLLVGDTVPAAVRDYLDRLGYAGDVGAVVQAASSVPRALVDQLAELV